MRAGGNMTEKFKPRLDILPKAQRRLWDELVGTPSEFTLYGGTAIALHLGHRDSIDFDFFGKKEFDPIKLAARVPFTKDARITQSEPNTLTVSIDRGGAVKVSFFGLPSIPHLAKPCIAEDINLKIASLLDLAGMKASVIQSRAEAKDYLDIDAILTAGHVDLPMALAAAKAIYGRSFNPESTLKALCYFDDGNVNSLPEETKKRLVKAAVAVNLDKLPTIKPLPSDYTKGVKP